ncbi:MAG: hydrogenase [SAR324 cluster bacterium]|nr:hydrogenase [SAR324 cluster bacterium]
MEILMFQTGCGLIFFSGILALFVPEPWAGKIAVTGLLPGNILLFAVGLHRLVEGGLMTFSDVEAASKHSWLILDGLSAFFMVGITLMSGLCGIYGLGYLRPWLNQRKTMGLHWCAWNWLTLAMIGVVTMQHLPGFLVSWELMLVFTLLLLGFEQEKTEVFQASILYLVSMHVSFILLLAGFMVLADHSGSWYFNDFHLDATVSPQTRATLFMLLVVGFGIKAGFVPLHTWLPHAHPVAPSHVSAMMSSVVIKMGIYGILRTLRWIELPEVSWSVGILTLGVLSALFGISYALAQRDIKRMLAYSSVENIGIIMIGIGLGMLGKSLESPLLSLFGFAGALLHLWNHTLFKGVLFLSAGSVYHSVHTRDMEQLGGLAKTMPKTAVLFLFGAIAICGFPPLNGFISEFVLYHGLVNLLGLSNGLWAQLWAVLGLAGLALVGGLALACFARAYGIIFSGKPRSEKARKSHEITVSMWGASAFLGAVMLLIGGFPVYVLSLLKAPLALLGIDPTILKNMTLSFSPLQSLVYAELLCLALGLGLWVWKQKFLVRPSGMTVRDTSEFPTWGCGYGADSPRLQYTSSSFVNPLLSLNKTTILEVEQHLPEGVFPTGSSLRTRTTDVVEKKLIGWPWQGFRYLLGWLATTQFGSTNIYLLYGLLYLGIIGLLAGWGVL